jgi:hypothetical protein
LGLLLATLVLTYPYPCLPICPANLLVRLQERKQQHDPPGTYEGQTALHIAIVNRDFDMVKFLVQVSVIFGSQDEFGQHVKQLSAF